MIHAPISGGLASGGDADGAPRICIASRRGLCREAFQAALYEAEDVLAEAAAADVIQLRAGRTSAFALKWQKRILFRGLAPKIAYLNPGLQTIRLAQDYDIFIAVCQNVWDLLYFNAIEGWKDRCRTSVCWLGELWAREIQRHPDLLRPLERFDHVVVTFEGTVQTLSQFLGRQCHLVTTGIDTLRFGPHHRPHRRPIDVYSIGRRWSGVHDALLEGSATDDLFYVHDTHKKMAEMEVADFKQHRNLFASFAKRSRYFLVSPGKMNQPDETAGQAEVGYRYFEGAAAGAVMLGQGVDCELFRSAFPWPDAVIEINPDGSDVLSTIADMDATPQRIRTMSQRNAAHSLRKHDWINRWLEIFRIAGVEPAPGMLARQRHLTELARTVSMPLIDGERVHRERREALDVALSQ